MTGGKTPLGVVVRRAREPPVEGESAPRGVARVRGRGEGAVRRWGGTRSRELLVGSADFGSGDVVIGARRRTVTAHGVIPPRATSPRRIARARRARWRADSLARGVERERAVLELRRAVDVGNGRDARG